jgi:GNAT superfamily N-acetyltransferase
MERLTVYTKPLVSLSNEEWAQVKDCNMGSMGSMRNKIQRLREDGRKDARVVMAWQGDILVGCALVFKRRDGEFVIYNYVKPNYRRRGIGTKLVKHARRGRITTLYACPWDDRSHDFYEVLFDQGVVADSKGVWT